MATQFEPYVSLAFCTAGQARCATEKFGGPLSVVRGNLFDRRRRAVRWKLMRIGFQGADEFRSGPQS